MVDCNRLTFCIALLAATFSVARSAGSAKNNHVGNWTVKAADGSTCIILKAEIKLGMQYIAHNSETKDAPELYVPVTSTATDGSSCQVEIDIGGVKVSSQVIRLTFDQVNNPGWYLELAFTKDKFGASDKEYVLYRAVVSANYSSMLDNFPNPSVPTHEYSPPLSVDGDVPEIATVIYADAHYSFYCPSKQKFFIVKEGSAAPQAWIQFRYLQLEAYSTSATFSEKETCPADQHEEDLLPIIVGSVLAGLVVITLAAYLVYRCRLPPEVINLTNPHSHFDDFAGHDNKAALTSDSAFEEADDREEASVEKRNGNVSVNLVQRRDSSPTKTHIDNSDLPL